MSTVMRIAFAVALRAMAFAQLILRSASSLRGAEGDEAIQNLCTALDCFASLAMTSHWRHDYTRSVRRVGKGANAPCPPSRTELRVVGTLRFAHPTISRSHVQIHPHRLGLGEILQRR